MLSLVLACQWMQPRPATVTVTSLPETSAPPLVTATSQPPISVATPTPKPIPTNDGGSTATPEVCPARQNPPLPSRPARFEEYPATLLAYLNAGADPLTLKDVLEEWASFPFIGQSLLRADLTGDGQAETIVVVTNPFAETYPPSSILLVLTCRAGSVTTLYRYESAEWTGTAIFAAEDLTQDGTADLLWADVLCGASTCYYDTHVGSWDGQTLVDRLDAPQDIPYATYEIREGALYIASAGHGSLAAGPQRPPTTVWRWNGEQLVLTETLLPPIQYRYHQFIEGERALAAGDLESARLAYETTITSTELLAWAGYTRAPDETAWLTALARWRLMEVSLLQGEAGMASFHYEQLQKTTPADSPAQSVLALARAFWNAYAESKNLEMACAAARALPQSTALLDFLNQFGFANPTYETEDLCPGLRE